MKKLHPSLLIPMEICPHLRIEIINQHFGAHRLISFIAGPIYVILSISIFRGSYFLLLELLFV